MKDRKNPKLLNYHLHADNFHWTFNIQLTVNFASVSLASYNGYPDRNWCLENIDRRAYLSVMWGCHLLSTFSMGTLFLLELPGINILFIEFCPLSMCVDPHPFALLLFVLNMGSNGKVSRHKRSYFICFQKGLEPRGLYLLLLLAFLFMLLQGAFS